MSGWGEFLLALAVFLASHAIPVRPPVRNWLIARLGRRAYFLAYSALSLAVLGWLVVAAARAPYVEVIAPLAELRWLPNLAMPPVCLLAVAGMSVQNPLSFGGMGRREFDPAAPGILGLSRHPLLLALCLWAGSHLPANGGLAHVILFGLFAGFAVAGMALIDRRKRREFGPEWQEMAANTAWLALRRPSPALPPAVWVGALLLWLALLGLHAPVIGLSPLP